MKLLQTLIETGILIAYLYNLVYAFAFWGAGHGILNIAFPYAIIADFVLKVGRF